MDQPDSEFVRPLGAAENYFLEVLLSRFLLTRKGSGTQLELKFDDQTPAIWGRHGVRHVQKSIQDFDRRAPQLQSELDAFLLQGKGARLEFDDSSFPFRYASGGTLPVIRRGDGDYYCLFFRPFRPVGWNIANGGCDSREELCNPLEAAQRELCEELLVVDVLGRRRYVFAGDADKPIDWPEFSTARKRWDEKLGVRMSEFDEQRMQMKWLDGPDHLRVDAGGGTRATVDGCFININAEDFGIEIDRVARINIEEDAVLLDGEMISGHLVNAPIGLFEVNRFNQCLASGATSFVPEWIFHNGQRYEPAQLEAVVQRFLDELAPVSPTWGVEECAQAQRRFGLCPVTKRIIARYLSLHTTTPPKSMGDCELFISFAGEDLEDARRVRQFYLDRNPKRPVFFSEENKHQASFLHAIDDALDRATNLIVVATQPAFFRKQWVQYEWERFLCDILNGHKDPKAKLVSFIGGIEPRELPGPFRSRQYVLFDPKNPIAGLADLASYVP